jgi:tartrate-resistant acid phosphatase type 5
MYLRERLAGEEAAGRASVSRGLFYRFRASADIEFVCYDTSKEDFFRRGRIYQYPKHWEFMQKAFPAAREDRVKWRIPFGHHPPFCAGPLHHNTRGMGSIVELFEHSGVRVSFSGHEHNFQHSQVNGIDYLVTGAGAKIRRRTPDRFEQAHTRSWSGECHFLLATIDGDRMTVRAIGESPAGELLDIPRLSPAGDPIRGPIAVGYAHGDTDR